MCPLWPLHIILLYVLCVMPMLLMANQIPNSINGLRKNLKAEFITEKVVEGQSRTMELILSNIGEIKDDSPFLEVEIMNEDPGIAMIDPETSKFMIRRSDFSPNSSWTTDFNVTGTFIGYAHVAVNLWGRMSNETNYRIFLGQSESSRIPVIRAKRAIDKIFVGIIILLVSIAFINMGCTLDMVVVKETLKRPVGPVIGFCCQYLFMPLCAFALAKIYFADNVALQLGIFVTGCCPGGGGSNMWTLILGGNLHLSITMTCLSTLAAFIMMPIWTTTLGRLIFSANRIAVPYTNIATGALALALPLMIGLLIRRFLPKVACVLAKTLKPIAALFLFIIITFGVYANLFLFSLMTAKVCFASASLVVLGYMFGGVAASLLRQPWQDSLAIAIETGLQNTGIAVFILRLTLDQPDADINTVIPVTVAIMTPVPLLLLWIAQKVVLHRQGICLPLPNRKCPVASGECGETNAKSLLAEETKENLKSKDTPSTVRVISDN